MTPPEGEVLAGRYRLVRRLGEGGWAAVWLARDTRLNRDVAIKIPYEHLSNDPRFRVRFEREAATAAKLRHPNIVRVYDFGIEEERPFLVMEHIEGETVAHTLDREGLFSPEEATRLAAEIADGLALAHDLGVTHRDIKPGNVMLERETASPWDRHAKILDFGIARAADDATRSLTDFFTPAYVAPERLEGQTGDARSDLYSLGITLYEMLTGEPPFSGDEGMFVARKHLSQEVPLPSESAPNIPYSVDEIVRRATQRDPGARYADGKEMAAALRATRPVLSRSPGQATVRMPRTATPILPGIEDERYAARAVVRRLRWRIRRRAAGERVEPSKAPGKPPDLGGLESRLARLEKLSRADPEATSRFEELRGLVRELERNLRSSKEGDKEPPGGTILDTENLESKLAAVERALQALPERLPGTKPATRRGGHRIWYLAGTGAVLGLVILVLFMTELIGPGRPNPIGLSPSPSVPTGAKNLFVISPDGGTPRSLPIDASSVSRVSWSPDGTELVFVEATNGQRRLTIADRTTGSTRPLLEESGTYSLPAWSPSGDLIAFAWDRGEDADIYVIEADGEGLRLLVGGASNETAPAWSPDGSLVAFVSDRGGRRDIYLIGMDGNGLEQLTNDRAKDNSPTWSVRGNRIAFTKVVEGQSDLFVMNIETNRIDQITHDPAEDTEPDWGPLTETIAFTSDRGGTQGIYLLRLGEAQNPIQLTDPSITASQPAWSPDGEFIAFLTR